MLAQEHVKPKSQTSTTREKLGADAALELARKATRIVIAKGKNVVTLDMKKDPPSDKELLEHMLGPTGNLRAPTIQRGKTLLVGYNEEMYQKFMTQ